MVFSEKSIEQNKFEKVDFLQIRHFYKIQMEIIFSKSRYN